MLERLGLLDENKAALRLVYILFYETQSSNRSELIEAAKNHGIGNTAFYKTLNTLLSLGIITEKNKIDQPTLYLPIRE